MHRTPPSPHAIDALTEAIIEQLEAALEISIQANTDDLVQQRQRWISLLTAGSDVAALARSLEILTRPP